ncbi:MAG: MBL fold metallo-hydrolase [Clostridia bacterium]|nr:MBL fold metallo-hydrolase [Clostridia bacterium]
MSKSVKRIILIICIVAFVVCFCIAFVKYSENSKQTVLLSDDFVEFFDVGQGDCALISSNGLNCLIDVGTSPSTDNLVTKLRQNGIDNLDLISVSHFHTDHTGGIYDIISKFTVKNLFLPKINEDTNIVNDVAFAKRDCVSNGGKVYSSKAGQTVNIGDFKLSVLYQNSFLKGENNRSVYIMANINGIKFFFTGDGESKAESELVKKNLNLDCDVLKVPHHGGSKSSTDKFLNACTPEYAVISCGQDNSYGHPHKETLERLKKRNIEIYRTDKSGDVMFFVQDKKMTISTEK